MSTGARSWPLRKYAKSLPTGLLVFPFLLSFAVSTAWAQGKAIIEVRAAQAQGGQPGFLEAKLADALRSIPGVSKVERYLYIRTTPHDVIGVEPGAPGRIVHGKKLLPIEMGAGRWFKEGDRNAAVVGKVFREDYLGAMFGMAMMKHYFAVGASFKLKGYGRRLRVIGKFAAKPDEAAEKIFLPLETAQKAFGKRGQGTHFFLTVDKAAREKVQSAVRERLGRQVRLLAR
ncbi:MAG: ABC transporter permease [Nitrospinota bacterium]